ncbi:MAG: HD-GYP domain-containing protein [Oscillospiraceae bacterium]|nr:HD-GYP domain-containing protein [Oscillospiraceae bacterium]
MKKKGGKLIKIINIILPVVIVLGASALLLQNYLYNTRERVYVLADAERDGTLFNFDDLTVEIVTRGGDSGSWVFDGLPDDDGNFLIEPAVGTIYEMVVTNNTADTVLDWTAMLRVPEEMYINNTWNGSFEFHQNVLAGNENVQTLNLAEYSRFDITLDGYMAHVGPMIALHEGDYFVYYPNTDMNEMPIPPRQADSNKEGGVRIGFIMYIQNRDIDYIADFSVGEIRYHMQTSIFKSPFFWVLLGFTIVWIVCLASTIAVNMNTKRFIEQRKRDEKAIEQTMQTFVNFIEAKDPSTSGHSLRVAEYSKMLAEKLGFYEDECNQIYYIALMHDCGKIYVPDQILTKPGRLTDEEYEIMKKHTVYGADILRDFTAIDGMGSGAISHHERYDGKGYPNGISGEDIPIIGRIICVSDAFDAMNSRRCYRSSLSEEVIISELKNNRGKQFDPDIVDCILSLINSGRIKFSDTNNEQ